MDEQRRYWHENPEAHRVELNRCKRHEWQLKYLTSPDLRRYNREKSKRRKARIRGNHVIHVTASQIRHRFAQFGHTCCYCGAHGDLHQEHFLPISKGGTHVLSNILPACQPCNYSKRDHEPEAWYRAQPFFTQQRWRLILTVLGKTRAPVGQLALL
jgi:5-methylcytosine-specific restriction endonuclease McrA